MAISSNTVIPTTFKGMSDNHGRQHPRWARLGAVLPYHPFGCQRNGNHENGYIVLLFLWWNNPCEAGVEAEWELESESIFSGRSRSQSCLKFFDSTSLILMITDSRASAVTECRSLKKSRGTKSDSYHRRADIRWLIFHTNTQTWRQTAYACLPGYCFEHGFG